MKSLQFDEHVGDSSSESSTSITITQTRSKKRRSKTLIRQYFRELSAIIPEASNKEAMLMDKEAIPILEGAIKYMKQLEERVKKLEEEEELTRPKQLLEIEVKTDGQDQQNVLIRIICEKEKGQIARIISEIEKLHLSVSSVSALPFGDQLLVISVSADQKGNVFSMTANDLKKNLRTALLKFMIQV